ncbi:hypothetical protein DVA67_011275 [Solirubrobacter sp. CPCC 204708]|uniref:Uncharacterized protein n=1 Tax=Solirubrobacter deserti TaxID=2282478 RepID=A0ABT4RHR2_9ACTN|nr:hypothetical protein [Solirubrobacter deserti]MBE2316560.1 hypothetical protein [Solirubrobacter deserti]MDA0138094.1 hypothetical protein [Solirubrobacter deserti]
MERVRASEVAADLEPTRRPADPPPDTRREQLSPEAMLALQQSAGNQAAVARLRADRAQISRNGNHHNKWDQKRSDRTGRPHKAKWLREQDAIKAREKKERNAKVRAVRRFMERQVAPWATQARIGQLINTNFEEMKADDSLKGDAKTLQPSQHRSADSTDPQIAPGDTQFLAPNKSGDTAIHRGIVGIEMVEGVPHVRVYSALWAEARPDKTGKITHKDVHQDPETGAIAIHTGRDQGEDKDASKAEAASKHPIMWLSAEPLRQLKWFYKYPIEKFARGAKPVVRSFLVPNELWLEISGAAVSEDEATEKGNEDKPFNVDTAYGSNQFGVRGPLLDKLRSLAAKNSLVSYVGDMSHSKPEFGGNIQHVDALHQQLGAPTNTPPKLKPLHSQQGSAGNPIWATAPIWVDPDMGKFARTASHGTFADALSIHYATWVGKDALLPDAYSKVPKPRRQDMLREFLTKNGHELPEDYALP